MLQKVDNPSIALRLGSPSQIVGVGHTPQEGMVKMRNAAMERANSLVSQLISESPEKWKVYALVPEDPLAL